MKRRGRCGRYYVAVRLVENPTLWDFLEEPDIDKEKGGGRRGNLGSPTL